MQSRLDRAKQFLPFDALNGFRDALKEVESEYIDKLELLDDMEEIINQKILELEVFDKVILKYYCNNNYIETTDYVIKIDKKNRYIYLENSKIFFDDIISINILEK